MPTCFSIMEAEGSSRTEVVFYQATWCWIQDSSLHENAGHHKMQDCGEGVCHVSLCVVCKGKLSVSCCVSLIWKMYRQRVCMSLVFDSGQWL